MAASSFEKDLEKLEQIVEALEQGELSLDECLKRFEEGIKLAKRCEKALTDAEKKIEILVKDAQGNIRPEPFGEEEGADVEERETGASQEDEEAPADDDTSGERGLLF